MLECQACHTQNPPGTSHCVKCARKLDAETQEAVIRRRAEHNATGINWTSVLTALIFLILVILVVALFVTHVI